MVFLQKIFLIFYKKVLTFAFLGDILIKSSVDGNNLIKLASMLELADRHV